MEFIKDVILIVSLIANAGFFGVYVYPSLKKNG